MSKILYRLFIISLVLMFFFTGIFFIYEANSVFGWILILNSFFCLLLLKNKAKMTLIGMIISLYFSFSFFRYLNEIANDNLTLATLIPLTIWIILEFSCIFLALSFFNLDRQFIKKTDKVEFFWKNSKIFVCSLILYFSSSIPLSFFTLDFRSLSEIGNIIQFFLTIPLVAVLIYIVFQLHFRTHNLDDFKDLGFLLVGFWGMSQLFPRLLEFLMLYNSFYISPFLTISSLFKGICGLLMIITAFFR